ncbi:MAG: Ig-like domain-containing protein [Chitinophagales bacterium]|nr:Ig-like domain-containing protein [Chitinophagales bacterium]MDW8393945.1 Ig-like domain-containing protein [Chitinophagales bacterium]
MSRIYFIFFVAILAACASQQPPGGGPKDLEPPHVVKSVPPPFATDFTGQSVRLTFSEFVKLSNPSSGIYLSPALSQPLSFRLRGKTLRIAFADSLRANTTYTLFLGNAISDLTEGNVLKDYRYVFSTGAAVDSLRLRGRVIHARTGQPQANMLVMLHKDLSDSAVVRRLPDYFVRTDSSGFFDLNYLRAGTYRLFALSDDNQNYLYDQSSELIAFEPQPITVSDTTTFVTLRAFQALPQQQLRQVRTVGPRVVQVVLARPYGQPQVSVPDNALPVATWRNASRDTLLTWLLQPADSIRLHIVDGDFSDTVLVSMQPPASRRKAAGAAGQTFRLASALSGMFVSDSGALLLAPSLWIDTLDVKVLARVQEGQLPVQQVPMVLETDSVSGRQFLSMQFPRRLGYTYRMTVPDSLCRDITGKWNDSLSLTVRVLSDEEGGNVVIRLVWGQQQQEKKHLFRLLEQKGSGRYERTLTSQTDRLTFFRLPPARYDAELIEDENGNGRWDTGDYWHGVQPERAYLFPAAVTVRSNWDVEVELNLSATSTSNGR